MQDPASVIERASPDRRFPHWGEAPRSYDDPDRLSTAMLQTVLALSVLSQSLSLALAWSRAIGIDRLAVGMAIVNLLVLLICLVLVHRGAVTWSARLFVAGSLVLLSVAYLRWGLAQQAPRQLLQLVPVLIGGALLGRHAMWATVAWLSMLVMAGGWRDAVMFAYHPYQLRTLGDNVLSSLLGFGLAAFVLERALANLRENLALARQRGNELARSRDRLQLEMQEKQRQHDQLVHAQKMESVGRLAGGVAHDFNHLLTLVLGHAARGRAGTTLEEAHGALTDVESAARRAAAVARRLLDFSRNEDTRPEVLDPAEAIAEMQPMLRQLFPARTALKLQLPPSQGLILFDRGQFELILLTLAANAEHAMPDGGCFTVTLTRTDAGMLEIATRDTGHGMIAAVRERCLEPFFTTKPSGQGTGLGLAVVASLVQAANGTIVVDSAPGQGTTVRITLPLSAPAIGAP